MMARVSSVITIGRQYASGGRHVGELLAKRLDIPFYDKAIQHQQNIVVQCLQKFIRHAMHTTFLI